MSVIDRTKLAEAAKKAAKTQLETGVRPVNPWPLHSDQAPVWQAAFERALVSDVLEGSAT